MSSGPTKLPPPGTADALYLVDISGYVFRAFFALPPLTNDKGEPTGALYGVTSMLLKLVREQQPGMLAVVMDSKGPSFRKELYPEYKANRPSAPPDLKAQMNRIKEVAEAYAIPCYEQSGVEADDLIASLTHAAREKGHQVVIVSADKDLLQLVDDGVVMFDSMRDKVFGAAETEAKMGVPPAKVRDLLALMGDSSDNVPGVPGVGPKTATTLLKDHGDIDGIYEALEGITKKALKKKLTENKDLAFLSRDLVTLKSDLDVTLDDAALKYGGWDDKALHDFYRRYGFGRLLDQVGADGTAAAAGGAPAPVGAPELPKAVVVDDATQLPALAESIREAGAVDLCCAVEGEEPVAGALVGIALAWVGHDTVYLPVGHQYLGCPDQVPIAAIREYLGPLFADDGIRKRSSSAKRDRIALANEGMTLAGVTFDTMLASYLLDPEQRGHELSLVALRVFDTEVPNYTSLVGKGKSATTLAERNFEEVLGYAAPQAQWVGPLSEQLRKQAEEADLQPLLQDIELPLTSVLATLERTGVACDPDRLRELSLKVARDLEAHERRCHELAGHEFNVASPRQLETILFDELALPVISRTKTARSTNHDVLEELAAMHELPAAILEHRQLAKLKNTYLDALPRDINARTGRIHSKFEQAVAATGRLSSTDPNLQNIPIRTEIGREIRQAFVAPEGCGILAADYSQIELRVLAHLSGDEELTDAFASDADVHLRTAHALFGVPEDQVSRDQRAAAKTVNFAVIYGQSQFMLARNLRIARSEAKRYIDAFFERYHGVRDYLDGLVVEARDTGGVRTLLGRRRLIKDIRARNRNVRAGAERIARNTPIQGSAADIIKLAMVRVATALDKEQLKSRMVLTVHDELVFEAPSEEREALSALVREAMEGAYELKVPLTVDVGWGSNWGEAH